MKRFALFSFLLPACGSSVPFASDDVAMFDGGPMFDSTVPFDSSFPSDAGNDAPKFGGGGPFLCLGCVCDGTLNYCKEMSGGKMPIDDAGDASSDADDASPFGDASACDLDAGYNECTQIPIACLPNPSCACVLANLPPGPCSCSIDPSGNGLVVLCVYP